MTAHPRHLPIELDGFLVMDMEDVYNPTFAKTEADAREVYRELDQRSARVFRMADGRHHDVTPDFIRDEVEADDERPINHIAVMRHIGAIERA